jgi:CHAD domain-containing protein
MIPCDASTTIRQFALAKTRDLLGSAVKAIGKAAESPDEEAVHKMRVSIRRLQQAIRLFRQFLPKRGVKRVRADLKRLMEPAGELRNHDIALKLLRQGNGPVSHMKERRIIAKHALAATLSSVARDDQGRRWSEMLDLGRYEDEKETVEA